jgi:hypothetical protein
VTNYDDLAKKINEEIKSAALKKMLLGMENVEAYAFNECIPVINGVLNFGFLTAFIKWKNDTQNQYNFPQTPNAKRVYNAFSRIYNGESVCLDLVIYVFTEMQLDEYAHREKSYFYGIISGGHSAIQIPSLRPLINMWLQSAKRKESNEKILAEKFLGLYNALPFLKDADIQCKKDILCFEKEQEEESGLEEGTGEKEGAVLEDGKRKVRKRKNITEEDLRFEIVQIILRSGDEPLDSHTLLIKNKSKFYYLSSYEVVEDKSILSYYSLNGSIYFCGLLPTKNFKWAEIEGNTAKQSPIIVKSMSSLSFQYIGKLALALSDSIRPATKDKLYELFSEKYYDVFELGFKKQEELNWDVIITFLIVEEGPTALLEIILDEPGFYFEKILKNLEIRYHDIVEVREKKFVQRIKNEYKEAYEREIELLKKYTGSSTGGDDNDEIACSLMANGIINGFADLECLPKKSETPFVESFVARIRKINKIMVSNESTKGKTLKINEELERTFRYIIPFYHGIFAYQQQKEEELNKPENKEKIDMTQNNIEKEILFIECQKKFQVAVKQCIKKIHRLPLGDLVDEFRSLCISISVGQREGGDDENAIRWKMLKSALGRDNICSVKNFNRVLKIKKPEGLDSSIKPPSDIVNFINNEKHANGHRTKRANFVMFDDFCDSVKALLYFFMYNRGCKRERSWGGRQFSFEPIYPYVVRYSTKSESRDGYHNLCSFTIFPSDESLSSEVKILSQRDYIINEKYYCIPNKNMSTCRWWIEPILIPCGCYDELIHKYFDHPGSDNDGNNEP